jgi:hypothetical protein
MPTSLQQTRYHLHRSKAPTTFSVGPPPSPAIVGVSSNATIPVLRAGAART